MIEHVPLLSILYDLYQQPRDMARFQAYLDVLLNEQKDDAELLPIVMANPMGREHLVDYIGQLLAFDAESIAQQAIDEAAQTLTIEHDYRHGLTVLDDAKGGWTQRAVTDANMRFNIQIPPKRAWISTGLWATDQPSPAQVRGQVMMSLYRVQHVQIYGNASTLAQMLFQEGMAGRYAQWSTTLDEEELAYSRAVIDDYLSSSDYSVLIPALYGDQTARELGYTPLGLSAQAGLEVAISMYRISE